MRGFGVNQIAFALEQQIDVLRRSLKMDPFEFRLLNALDVGLPTAADHILEAGVVTIKETIEAVRKTVSQIQLPAAQNGKKVGIGVASAVKNIGFGHGIHEEAGAIIELDSDGSCVVRASQHDYGQGARIGLIQLAANELNLPVDRIQVIGPDTALTPPTGPTTASRQTFLTGNAVVKACRVLKEQLIHRAADLLDVPPENLELNGNKVINKETGQDLPLSRLGKTFKVEETYVAPGTAPLQEGAASLYGESGFESRPTYWCYAYNTQAAIVEVDETSGEVNVLTVVSANDVGKAINKQVIEGQIDGGVMMGIGYALSEEFIMEKGRNLADSLNACGIPLAEKTPRVIPEILEIPHPHGPQGVKGFAEAPSLATAPAIINAIYDAVGERITSLPADKNKVKAAVRAAFHDRSNHA